LFDTLRSKINAEYGLADPSDPARARKEREPSHRAKIQAAKQDASKIINLRAAKGTPNPERARLLEAQLQKLVERRAAYHQERYPTPVPESQNFSPIYDRARTSSPEFAQPARIPISGARPAVCRYAGELEQATERWRQACGSLESSHARFERAYRTLAINLEQKVSSLERMTTAVPALPNTAKSVLPASSPVEINPLLKKYGIPARQQNGAEKTKPTRVRGLEIEMDMTLNDR
jgi:hypothetical protein